MAKAAPKQNSRSSRTLSTTLSGVATIDAFDALTRLMASIKRQHSITLRRLDCIEQSLRGHEEDGRAADGRAE